MEIVEPTPGGPVGLLLPTFARAPGLEHCTVRKLRVPLSVGWRAKMEIPDKPESDSRPCFGKPISAL
jgi:hypothetical protein